MIFKEKVKTNKQTSNGQVCWLLKETQIFAKGGGLGKVSHSLMALTARMQETKAYMVYQ